MANTLLLKTYNGGTNYSTGGANASVYTVPSLTTTIVIGFTISNIIDNDIKIGVYIDDNDASQSVNFAKNLVVPTGTALEIMSGNKLILNASDVLKVTSNTASSFDVSLSIVEQT